MDDILGALATAAACSCHPQSADEHRCKMNWAEIIRSQKRNTEHGSISLKGINNNQRKQKQPPHCDTALPKCSDRSTKHGVCYWHADALHHPQPKCWPHNASESVPKNTE
jgi:hypothetical protein